MTYTSSRTLALTLILTFLAAGAALAIEREPVPCSEGFLMQDNPGTLLDGNTFQPLVGFAASSPSIEFNNLGWRSTDKQLYALELTGTGNNGMIRIDGDWDFEYYGPLAGLPDRRYDAGEISTDGTTMYIHIGSDNKIFLVDLTPVDVGGVPVLTGEHAILGGAAGKVHDWAYHPDYPTQSAMLFGGDDQDGEVAALYRDDSVSPAVWRRADFPVAGLPSGIAFGGARFNSDGNLVLYRNRVEGDDTRGTAYEIDVDTMTIVSQTATPGTFFQDATSCIEPVEEPECDEAYFVQDVGASLFKTNTASASFSEVTQLCNSFELSDPTLEPLSAAVELNNMCYRKQDGMLYALELFKGPGGNANEGGNNGLVRIDPNSCQIDRLGVPAGLPTEGLWARFDAGDCTADGETMFVNIAGRESHPTAGHLFYAIDIDTMTASEVQIERKRSNSNFTGNVHDWARNPVDGKLYGGDSTQGHLATLEMIDNGDGTWTGLREDRNLTNFSLPRSGNQFGAYGGAWFNGEGLLVLHRNNGEVFEIDVASRELMDETVARSSGYNDAASCIGETVEIDE